MPKYNKTYQNFLDHERILRSTPNTEKLKVTLRHDKERGVGLFATKFIKKGELIALYKMTVFNVNTYKSPTKNVYAFDVYRKNGRSNDRLIGDIDLESLPDPLNNVPFWAPFANESSESKSNAEVDNNLAINYANRRIIKPKDVIIYYLKASRNIKKGEEITWYYGDSYLRNYVLN